MELIKILHQASFKDNKDGFLRDSEIRAIVEKFYGVKFDYANYIKFRNHLRIDYQLIYKPRLKNYEMKTYAFVCVDEIEFLKLIGDISEYKSKNIKSILK